MLRLRLIKTEEKMSRPRLFRESRYSLGPWLWYKFPSLLPHTTRSTVETAPKLVNFCVCKTYLKNPAKRRSALNLQLCIDYYIQNRLNTCHITHHNDSLNTHHNSRLKTHHNTHHNTPLNTHLYTHQNIGVGWAVTKC